MKHAGALLVCLAVVVAGCGGGNDPASNRRALAALEPLADNTLPFGVVDVPRAQAVVPAMFNVAGWALDEEGIEVVHIYADGKYKASSRLTVERPDVSKAYPTYARQGNRHGFNVTVTIGTPGVHKLTVQAVDVKGATRDIGEWDIVVN
jgi:Bacterial Ig domain